MAEGAPLRSLPCSSVASLPSPDPVSGPIKSSLEQGFLKACKPLDATLVSPQPRSEESGHGQIMAELKQVARVSSETAHAVAEMIKQMGCLRDLLQQQTLKQSNGSNSCHVDVDSVALTEQITAQLEKTLTCHHDDLSQLVENSVSRHMQQLSQQLQALEQQQQQQQRPQLEPQRGPQPDYRSESSHSGAPTPMCVTTTNENRSATPDDVPQLRDLLDPEITSEAAMMEFSTKRSTANFQLGQDQLKWWYNHVFRPALMLLVGLDFVVFLAGLQVTMDHLVRQPAEQPPTWILAADIVLVVCFVLDVLLRVYVSKLWRHPCEAGADRLYFDAIVTALSLLDVILRVANGTVLVASLRSLRLLRILRVVHVKNTLDTLGQRSRWLFESLLVLECLDHAMLPLLTVLLVLFIIGLLFAMLFSQIVVSSLVGGNELLTDMELVRLYGSLWDTYFTLFAAITGGAEWRQLLDPLEAFSWQYRYAFSFLVAFMKFGVFNIVSAVLFVYVMRCRDTVLQMETLMNQERDKKTLKELREVFLRSKKVHSGRMTEKTCLQLLQEEGMKHLNTLGLTIDRVMSLFRMLDQDSHRRKDVNEFLFLLANSEGDQVLMLAAIMKCETTRVLHQIDKVMKLSETGFAQVLKEDPAVLGGRMLP